MATGSGTQSKTRHFNLHFDLAANDNHRQHHSSRIREEADKKFSQKRHKVDRYLSAKAELQTIFGEKDLW